MAIYDAIFSRSELLLGKEVMEIIAQKRVIIFGVGGVGSWCAESLVRTGIRQLTIVDNDSVCESNINRQLMATAEEFALGSYDYIIDAIDSLKDKALLILMACKTDAKLFSSMGAALKLDPTRIKVTEFWKVQGDPLARVLRKKFKSRNSSLRKSSLWSIAMNLFSHRERARARWSTSPPFSASCSQGW